MYTCKISYIGETQVKPSSSSVASEKLQEVKLQLQIERLIHVYQWSKCRIRRLWGPRRNYRQKSCKVATSVDLRPSSLFLPSEILVEVRYLVSKQNCRTTQNFKSQQDLQQWSECRMRQFCPPKEMYRKLAKMAKLQLLPPLIWVPYGCDDFGPSEESAQKSCKTAKL